ncbi:hypothetical protein O3S81_24905 [Agrobacterium sp. SOY23]|uniref:hypothetical protein n=1 Tax=Agrobacterium sp. SOY23 TaxID=3014555 RepID=UPI0022AEE319|nr:hypothetical protein [Agrobacterium sp. SOY23]MCZ4432955.1 hypothetical protein [Agrobacterium sp. SOY23]
MQAIVKKGAQHGHVAFGRVSLISNQEKPAHAATPRLQYETHHNLGSTELLHPMQAIIKKGAQHGHVAFGRVSLISNQEKPAHAATPRLQYETHHDLGSTELLHPMQAIVKKGAQHGHVAFGRVSLISNQEKPAHAATPRLQYETRHNLGNTELLHPMQAIADEGRAPV